MMLIGIYLLEAGMKIILLHNSKIEKKLCAKSIGSHYIYDD